MRTSLAGLHKRIHKATGPSGRIDRAIAVRLDCAKRGQPVPPYTASVDACLALIGRVLPGWHWHVGHGATGIVPHASMTRNDDDADPVHVEAAAPPVPLALPGAGRSSGKAVADRRLTGRDQASVGEREMARGHAVRPASSAASADDQSPSAAWR